MSRPVLVLSCEHATAALPAAFARRLRIPSRVLQSHRGWDPGARELAEALGRAFSCPPALAGASRLLVDTNRSLHHPRVFSEWSRHLPAPLRERAVARYWQPHRRAVTDAVAAARRRDREVVHLSVHSFVPVLRGERRRADVALLYDPARRGERAFADAWLAALGRELPDLRLRRNYPYRGVADGLTRSLRLAHPDGGYRGLELEVNQRLVTGPRARWRELVRAAVAATRAALEQEPRRVRGSAPAG